MNLTPSVRATSGTNERMTPAGGFRILCASEWSGGHCAQLFWLSSKRLFAAAGREGKGRTFQSVPCVSFQPSPSSDRCSPARPRCRPGPRSRPRPRSSWTLPVSVQLCLVFFLHDSLHVLMHTHTHTPRPAMATTGTIRQAGKRQKGHFFLAYLINILTFYG